MKSFFSSFDQLLFGTKCFEPDWSLNFAWIDYEPEKNGPGLSRSTLNASACVRLYNISKVHAFPMF